MRLVIFGEDDCFMKREEIVYMTKCVTVVHLSSHEWMKFLLTQADLCGAEFIVGGNRHTCSGKVICLRNGRNVIGYITHESNSNIALYQILERSGLLTMLLAGEVIQAGSILCLKGSFLINYKL